MFEQIGGRKLVASLLVMIVGVVVTALKGDIPSGLLQLLEVTLGTFVGGNVVNTFASVLSQRGNGAGSDVEDKTPGEPIPASAAPVAPPVIEAAEAPIQPSNADIYNGLQLIFSRVEGLENNLNAQLKTLTEGSVVVQRSANKLIELALKQ